MSTLSQRRHKKSLHVFHEDQHNTSRAPKQYQQQQFKKYKNIIQDLQKALKQEKFQKQQLKQRLQMLATRTVLRQRQFHNILKSVHPEVIKFHQPQKQQLQKNLVVTTFQKIFQNFQKSNQATNNFIEKRYIQNMNTMENKIAYIKQIFDQQTTKFKRISNLDHLKIQREIQQVLQIAKSIQQDNIKTKKILNSQTFKNKLLQSQKQLLIEQIVRKKKLITKLYFENKRMKQNSPFKKQNKIESPQLFNQQEIFPQFKNSLNQTIKLPTDKNKQKIAKSIYTSELQSNRGSKSNNGQFITNLRHSRLISHKSQRYQKQHSNRGKSSTITSRIASSTQRCQKKINKNENLQKQCLSNTIQHLKLCLQRQRKRNMMQGKQIAKILNQNQQLHLALMDIIQQLKKYKQQNPNNNQLDSIIKNQKLLQILQGVHPNVEKFKDRNIIFEVQDFEQFKKMNQFQNNTEIQQAHSHIKQSLNTLISPKPLN